VSIIDTQQSTTKSFQQLLSSRLIDNSDDADDDDKGKSSFLHGVCKTGVLAGDAADIDVRLRMAPLRLVLHAALLDDVVRFFRPSGDERALANELLATLEHETAARVANWSAAAAEALATTFALSSRRVALDIDAYAPTLVLPRDVSDAHSSSVTLDLGRLRLSNADEPPNDNNNNNNNNNNAQLPSVALDVDAAPLDQRLYRVFSLRLARASIIVASDVSRPASRSALLSPFDVSLRLLIRRSKQYRIAFTRFIVLII
jgi:hypothetical protein